MERYVDGRARKNMKPPKGKGGCSPSKQVTVASPHVLDVASPSRRVAAFLARPGTLWHAAEVQLLSTHSVAGRQSLDPWLEVRTAHARTPPTRPPARTCVAMGCGERC